MVNNKDIEVFGFNFHTVSMGANTFVGDKGIYTLISGNGLEIRIRLGEVNRDNYEEVYKEHVDKINEVMDKFGAAEEVRFEEFLSDVVYQLLGYVKKNKKIVEEKEEENEEGTQIFRVD